MSCFNSAMIPAEERWRPIVGYEGTYSVSNKGRIRRDSPAKGTQIGRILKPRPVRSGYLLVVLCRNKTQIHRSIHHLVLEAFTSLRPDGYEANHIDGNKKNNSVKNLEWVTPLQNMRHSHYVLGRNMARGNHHRMSKLDDATIIKMRNIFTREQCTYSALAARFGIHKTNARLIILRKAWKHI